MDSIKLNDTWPELQQQLSTLCTRHSIMYYDVTNVILGERDK